MAIWSQGFFIKIIVLIFRWLKNNFLINVKKLAYIKSILYICLKFKNKTMKTNLKKGDLVTIKGYKKIHTVTAVRRFNPPKGEKFTAYNLSDVRENHLYERTDLIKLN